MAPAAFPNPAVVPRSAFRAGRSTNGRESGSAPVTLDPASFAAPATAAVAVCSAPATAAVAVCSAPTTAAVAVLNAPTTSATEAERRRRDQSRHLPEPEDVDARAVASLKTLPASPVKSTAVARPEKYQSVSTRFAALRTRTRKRRHKPTRGHSREDQEIVRVAVDRFAPFPRDEAACGEQDHEEGEGDEGFSLCAEVLVGGGGGLARRMRRQAVGNGDVRGCRPGGSHRRPHRCRCPNQTPPRTSPSPFHPAAAGDVPSRDCA